MNRHQRRALANDTMDILREGKYKFEKTEIDISNDLLWCCENTYSIAYDKHKKVEIKQLYKKTIFSVARETTIEGIEYANQNYSNIGALNFASAKNPGGGFLSGSQAQEESLARSSGLYKSLNMCPEYYQYHKDRKNSAYSDYMIVSPKVPFFRKDNGDLRKVPVLCTIITSPAVNKGATRNKEIYDRIPQIMKERVKKFLTTAYLEKLEILILGAWGCGVFRNEPEDIADIFKEVIETNFMGAFKELRFSILDNTGDKSILQPFKDNFKAL